MAIKNPIYLFLPLQISLGIIFTLKIKNFYFNGVQVPVHIFIIPHATKIHIPTSPVPSRPDSLASRCKIIVIDTIQERSNSDFDVKCATIQFYGNSYNSQSDCWIELKVYVESPACFPTLVGVQKGIETRVKSGLIHNVFVSVYQTLS